MSDNPFGADGPSHGFVPLRPTTRSPSPSRSPTRGDGFNTHVLDPLLSDLSPSKTLEALSSSPTFVSNDGRSTALEASIAVATPAQRAFAVRAALAHKKLREWSVELSSWDWPPGGELSGSSRGFQVPSWEERAAKRRRTDSGRHERKKNWGAVMQSGGGGSMTAGKTNFEIATGSSPEFGASDDGGVTTGMEADDEYWGSLPAHCVLEYEQRVEAIKGEMEALDLEELKNQVLGIYVLSGRYDRPPTDMIPDAHIPSRSRPSSSYGSVDSEASLGNYVPLGDFTALITATTLQALPYLSRVISLLNTWVIRIAVLRAVPIFLANLEEIEDLLESAFEAIVASSTAASHPTSQHRRPSEGCHNSRASELRDLRKRGTRSLPISPGEGFSRDTFNVVREILEGRVTSLGQLLDNMLDDLEGRDDTIPEEWIEQMEAIEESYGNWVVEAEKTVLETEWRLSLQAQIQQLDSARNSEKTNASKDCIGKTRVNGDIPEEDEASSKEAVVGAYNLVPGDTSGNIQATQGPDLLPVPQTDDARDSDRANEVNPVKDMLEVTGLKEEAASNWEADGDVVCSFGASGDIPATLSSAQHVDDDRDYDRVREANPDGNIIKVTRVKGEMKYLETHVGGACNLVPDVASRDIPTSWGLDLPLAQQLDDARDCEEADQASEVLDRGMTGEVGVAEDITEMTKVVSDQASEGIPTTLGPDLTLPRQADDAEAAGKKDGARIRDNANMSDEVDAVENITRISKAAGDQPRENEVNGQEVDGGVYSLVQDASRRLPDMPSSVSSPRTPEAPTAEDDPSEVITTDTVTVYTMAQANCVYPSPAAESGGQELLLNVGGRPETPPLQCQLLSRPPAISPPTSQTKAGSRSLLDPVDLGDICYNIAKPSIFADSDSVGTSSTQHPTNIENSAFFNFRRINKDRTVDCPDGIDSLPDKPLHGERNLQIMDTKAQSVELLTEPPTGLTRETEPPDLDSPWTSPVRPGFDSDNSQNSPNLSIQSSPSKPAFQLRDLVSPKFKRPANKVVSQSPIDNVSELLSPAISVENLAMETEQMVGLGSQPDPPFNKEGLGIRDLASETGSHVSAGGGANVTETTEESDVHEDDQLEADPRGVASRSDDTNHPINLIGDELSQEESAAGAELKKNRLSAETPLVIRRKEIALESGDFPSPLEPAAPMTDDQLKAVGSDSTALDSLLSSGPPILAALENLQATAESYGQFNAVETDSTSVTLSSPDPPCSPDLAASEILPANMENHRQSNSAEPLPSPQVAIDPLTSIPPESAVSEIFQESRDDGDRVNAVVLDCSSPGLANTKADGVVGGTVPGGEGVVIRPNENGNSSPKAATFAAAVVRPDRQTHVKDGSHCNALASISDGTPEALQHVQTRSLYSSPSTMDHTPEGMGPQTPTFSVSSGNSTVSRRSEPPTPLPSLPLNDIEEQSPSVRQYMRRRDTASSEDDALGSLPALQIPKRRRGTHSNPEKPLMTREKPRQQNDDWAGTGDENFNNRSPVELSKATTLESPVESADDHLEQKINSILTTVPARICLSSEIEVEPSPNGRSSPPKSYATVSPGVRPLRATSASPSFTLAPAYAKNPRPRAKGGNPDIKLYHLHRSNGEAPIKLFVRLVGENGERVMVRVGGGWADLGEYLKEYATHHGRRSASDGRIEIQNIPKLNSRSSVASLKAQAAGRSTPTSRPDSVLGRSTSSLSFSRTRPPPSTPPAETRTPTTPHLPISRRQELTPPSNSSSVSSPRSSSRLSWTEEEPAPALGLAGPKSRKVDMAPDKQAWVEVMLGQVRKASAQKREEGDFGSLGRIGGTKRVFRRGSKGAGDEN